MKRENMIWSDRKRNIFGLPWTFTKYAFDENRLFIETGLLNSTEDEVRLYRVTDLTLKRSLWQKIIGTGTINCDSADKTLGDFEIKNIKDAYNIKEQLSSLVETARKNNRVYARESMDYDDETDGDGMDDRS